MKGDILGGGVVYSGGRLFRCRGEEEGEIGEGRGGEG
jgi:hypothetical protein